MFSDRSITWLFREWIILLLRNGYFYYLDCANIYLKTYQVVYFKFVLPCILYP